VSARALVEALVFRSQTGVLFYDILNAEQAFTADRQILKDITLANQELDILEAQGYYEAVQVIYDTIDTVKLAVNRLTFNEASYENAQKDTDACHGMV
jgi:hypothetical protein